MKKKEPPKNPPAIPIKSLAYNLFSQFIANNRDTVSNSLELFESIPKYFLSPFQAARLRTDKGHADPYELSYSYNGTPFTVKIQAALIKQKTGGYKAFFFGETEELVEEVLKKILTYQNCSIHDPRNVETWIKFSLSAIQRELKLRKKTRSLSEIKHAIKVMSDSIITLYRDGEEMWSGSILSDLRTVDREKYLNETDSLHVARLPMFISFAIDQLEYRQFNYDRLMSCREQLSRWLYKKLINRYKQASTENDYHFNFSTIQSESGFLQQSRIRDNRIKVINALEELIRRDVICSYKTKDHKTGKKIVDVTYILTPSTEFIKEQKAANKRSKISREKLRTAQITLPVSPKKTPPK